MSEQFFWRRPARAATLAVLALSAVPSASTAAPATVDLRIEGPTSTLFEGRVTTDVRPFQFTGDPVPHECDGTAAGGGGTSATPVTVRNNAISTAMAQSGLTATGTWFSFGASFDTINGQNVAYDPVTNKFLAEYKNGVFASTGGCSDPVVTGDSALYAYADGSEPLLGLRGPATARPGGLATLTVYDLGSSAPVAGAGVAGATSAGDGTVTVGPLAAGPTSFKATKTGTIRSNAVTVCATTGSDGLCGTTKPGDPAPPPAPPCATNGQDGLCATTDRTAPLAVIRSIRDHARFRRGNAPRELAGIVRPDPSGIRDVQLRITRRDGPRCFSYDAAVERFVRTTTCGAAGGRYFPVAGAGSWSYLLPADLPRGRYVIDAQVTDRAGNTSAIIRNAAYRRAGGNRVVVTIR